MSHKAGDWEAAVLCAGAKDGRARLGSGVQAGMGTSVCVQCVGQPGWAVFTWASRAVTVARISTRWHSLHMSLPLQNQRLILAKQVFQDLLLNTHGSWRILHSVLGHEFMSRG